MPFNLKYIITIGLTAMLAAVVCVAQTHPVLARLQKANPSRIIAYDYRVLLVNTSSGVAEDSIKGKLYKSGANYLDSSAVSISARKEKFFCKVHFPDQSVTVYDLGVLAKKIGAPFHDAESDVIMLSDSLIAKTSQLDIRKDGNGNFVIEVVFDKLGLSKAIFGVDENTYIISSITLETIERNKYDELTGYKKVYSMTGIKYRFDQSVLNLQRFFKSNGNKIVLNGNYSKYKLHTLTN